MPPLKERLGMRMQKVQSIFRPSKRRIAEDDASNQPPKQLRTMLAENKTSAQDPLFQTPPSTSVSGSSRANKTTDRSSGGIKALRASTAIPFLLGHGEPHPGSSKENPIDLDGPASYHSPSVSSTQTMPIGSSFSSPISLDDDERQVLNDEAIAQALQDEYDSQPKPNHEFFLPLTKEETQKQVEDLKAKYHRRTCYRCHKINEMKADSLMHKTRSMLKEGHVHPFTKCSSCRYEGCMACGAQAKSFPPEMNNFPVTNAVRGSWCCSEGRAFVIFSLLCGFEHPAPTKIPKFLSNELPQPQQKQPDQQTSIVFAKGTGYGGSNIAKPFKQAKKFKLDSEEALSYFLTLAEVLPSVEKKEFDSTPGLRVMVQTSPMVRLACEVLRSAAIEEMDKRADIIKAALRFVQSLSRNWDAASSIFHDQIMFPPSEQLLMATLCSKKQAKSSEKVAHETAQSIYTVVERLAVTCRVFLEGSKSFTVDGDEAIGIALQVCDLQDFLAQLEPGSEGTNERPGPVATLSSRSTVVTRSKGKELDLMAAVTKMADYHKEHGAMEIADHTLTAKFFCNPQTTQSSTARMRKLFAQISSLHSDLPDGIYVRYGESRPDMLKVLMFGPENTPYEHGIFLFDIFCDQDFPQKPPQVQYLTTGGGRARFNPNLYQNGKVCLSLLGTWEGPSWVPDTSTILQILVSIQSMVFVENPYFNEPGYENRPDLAQSESYNRDKENLTLQYAIIPWLSVLDKAWKPQPSDLVTLADCRIWGDIVLKHFELKGSTILAKVKEWQSKPNMQMPCATVAWLEATLQKTLAVPSATGEAGQPSEASKPSAS
ncbi:putative baculoviral IAP repeat-containing protein [Triangularia setosa]|uniref:Baculoviral IAP repeat-containing protein n=1 Tax=Triangularia setosa TaxID=2587417 RepID=A0AAN7AA68_9PEZI|nr:putative baculoviral IAP repeat-containing protein [Podospora setosa]